jgi:uncharacterized peroxidase-related enzyme
MTRLHTAPLEQAEGKAAELFKKIKGAAGFVPNAYADLGANNPEALEFVLGLDALIRKTSLTMKDVETIRIAVSQDANCHYCLAAHTVFAQRAGISAEAIYAFRHGKPSGDARIDAVAAFSYALVSKRGLVAPEVLAEIRAAGFSDRQITDVLLVIAGITFTNLFNRVNDTVLDFPDPDASR